MSVEAPQALRGWVAGEVPHRGGVCAPPQKFFLHFHVEMAHFGGYFGCKFKFYSMNKTLLERVSWLLHCA